MTPIQFQKISKNLFSNLVESLRSKLLKPPDKFNHKSIFRHVSSFAITANFFLIGATEKNVLKIMQDIKCSKAAGEIFGIVFEGWY